MSRKKAIYIGDSGYIETKTLGWLKPEEHPDGLLCRPCPVCGYKYGSAWHSESVPDDVLNRLKALPNAAVPCAWNRM
jgi:hypothetical protein